MDQIKLYEIYGERHIIVFEFGSMYYYGILDDLTMKELDELPLGQNILQILKYSDTKFLLLYIS